MAQGVFAGIAVSDFAAALQWYQRLLGREPTFFANDVEAVWQLSDNCHVYIIQDTDRAGGAVNMIWVDDPQREVVRIAQDGLEPDGIEKHDPVWKYVFHDCDGNEIGIGGEVGSTDEILASGSQPNTAAAATSASSNA